MVLSWTALLKYTIFVTSKNCIFSRNFFDVTKAYNSNNAVPDSTMVMVIDSLYEFSNLDVL